MTKNAMKKGVDRILTIEHFQDCYPSKWDGTNVNGGDHRDMCLIEEFLSFMGEKCPNSECLTWTEPTVAHYVRDTVHFLEEAGMAILKGDDTPPKLSRFAQ